MAGAPQEKAMRAPARRMTSVLEWLPLPALGPVQVWGLAQVRVRVLA